MATSRLFVDPKKIEHGEEDKFAIQFARIETHYFVHGAFFDTDEWILENAHKIKHIPTIIA
jgi:proline iminopeptidase